MRDLINIVVPKAKSQSSLTLLEGRNYDEMFTRLIKIISEINLAEGEFYRGVFREEITWAKRVLRRADRITWYLRISRLCTTMLTYLSHPADGRDKIALSQEQTTKVLDLVKEYQSNCGATGDDYVTFVQDRGMKRIRERLEHYLAMNVPAIQNETLDRQSPHTLFQHWANIEHEYTTQQSQHLPIDNNADIIFKFGDNFEWVNLHKPYCDDEARAMGHCGNRGSGRPETVLSLRERVKTGKDTWWRPALTFILDERGILGEMKGRGNTKPAERYHRYIVELLKSPLIKGIKGGGYLPQNNFAVEDLDEDTREHLYQLKPALMPLKRYYEHVNGQMDAHLYSLLKNELDANDLSYFDDQDMINYVYIYRYDSLSFAGMSLGDHTFGEASRIMRKIDDPKFSPLYDDEYRADVVHQFIDAIDPAYFGGLSRALGYDETLTKEELAQTIIEDLDIHDIRPDSHDHSARALYVVEKCIYSAWEDAAAEQIADDIFTSLAEQVSPFEFTSEDHFYWLRMPADKVIEMAINGSLPDKWTDLIESLPTVTRLHNDPHAGYKAYYDCFRGITAKQAYESQASIEIQLHKQDADRWAIKGVGAQS